MAHFQRQDFDSPGVHQASNPSTFGYHHGPIPNPNPGYGDELRRQKRTVDTANAAPNAHHLSKLNGGICWVVVDGEQMCGKAFASARTYGIHVRREHCGATRMDCHLVPTVQEITDGKNALKKYVLNRGWRSASFLHEPGRGPANGLINAYATALEAIAAADASFSDQFGDRFHRDSVHSSN